MNRRYRVRSPENIVEELIRIKDAGYEYVIFFDDNLTANIKHTNKLCQLIIQNQLNLKFASTCMPYLLPDDTLELMSRAGFLLMFVGVESGSDILLKEYRKPGNSSRLIRGIQRAQRTNILVIASFISGHCKETPEDHEASKKLIRQALPFFSEINPLMVHPGSALWDEIHRDIKPTKLKYTHSRLISRFPGQHEKKTIEFRLNDFRKTQQNQWKNWRIWLIVLRTLRKNRLGFAIFRALVARPTAIFQLVKGIKPR